LPATGRQSKIKDYSTSLAYSSARTTYGAMPSMDGFGQRQHLQGKREATDRDLIHYAPSQCFRTFLAGKGRRVANPQVDPKG